MRLIPQRELAEAREKTGDFKYTHSDIRSVENRLIKAVGNTGTGTIDNGTTSVNITHGLPITPTRVQITLTSSLGDASEIYVSAKASTTFTVTVDADPGADVTFDWRATAGEGS
jgi:hypothetical protein